MTHHYDFSNVVALVVEDDSSGGAIIGIMLEWLGIEATVTPSGGSAIKIARSMKPKPTIFFLDLNLNDMTGYDLIKMIRKDRKFKHTLVVAMTARDEEEEIPKCQAAGFDGFIGKPLSQSTLPDQIHRILNGESVWEAYTSF